MLRFSHDNFLVGQAVYCSVFFVIQKPHWDMVAVVSGGLYVSYVCYFLLSSLQGTLMMIFLPAEQSLTIKRLM